MADSNSVSYYQERLGSLRTEREPFIAEWKDISDYGAPRTSRFFVQDRGRTSRRNNKILNEAVILAARTLRSGMMSGVTNPGRPWMALQTADQDLNEYKPVKEFLETTRNRMMQILLRSNVYTTLPMAYGDQGMYGTTAYLALEDPESLLRCYHYPVGSYMLAADHRGRMDTNYREFSMTARQMIAKFGKDRCSKTTQSLASQGAGKESWVPVVHAIEPNPEYHPGKAHFAYYKKFHSCYFEAGGDSDKKLHSGGFDRNPVISPRWDVVGEDVYGGNCPGMESIGSNKVLQLREKRRGQFVDKTVAPPMKGPASLETKRNSILAGDMTYIENSANAEKFEPVFTPAPAVYQVLNNEIEVLENRIDRLWYADLFRMFSTDLRSNVTAAEIAKQNEEQLLQLGPVYLRQNDEHFDPLFDLLFEVMARQRILPKIPPEMLEMDISVEYISIMSQAMKLVGIGADERALGFAANVIQIWPEIRHLVNPFNLVTGYFTKVGASPQIANDKKDYEAAVLAEAKQLQAQQMAAAAPAMADTAKMMSETKLDTSEGDTALSRVSEMMNKAAA